MTLTPSAELPTLKRERERPITMESAKESLPDSPIHQNSQSNGTLEDKVLENLDEVERGLRPYMHEGRAAKGIVTDFGKIDVLAIDKNDNFVAVKVKMGLAQQNELCSTLASIGWLKKSMKIQSLVRVIMVAESFDEKTVFSAKALPNLELMRYEIKPALTRVKG